MSYIYLLIYLLSVFLWHEKWLYVLVATGYKTLLREFKIKTKLRIDVEKHSKYYEKVLKTLKNYRYLLKSVQKLQRSAEKNF